MLNSKPHSEVKNYRVKECQNCQARNIITVPDTKASVIPVCPQCGECPTISSYGDCPHNPVHAWREKAMCLKAQIKTRKRAKQVFSTGEIPHLWAHKVQPSAHNSQWSMSFENGVIYSYRAPIAAHIENKRGNKAILFNSRRYSITTSGHQGAIRAAIPSNVTVFDVSEVWSTSIDSSWTPVKERHEKNVKNYLFELNTAISKAQRARTLYSKGWEHGRAKSLRAELIAYCKFFGLACPKNLPQSVLTSAMVRKIKAREAFLQTPEHRAKLEQERVKRAGKVIENWRNGTEYVRLPHGLPTMLRIRGEEIETSMGARVPIDHAKRVLGIIRTLHAENRAFESNGHTIPIGVYKVDKIDADGMLHAGCHHIPYAEIERIGVLLDAMPIQAQA